MAGNIKKWLNEVMIEWWNEENMEIWNNGMMECRNVGMQECRNVWLKALNKYWPKKKLFDAKEYKIMRKLTRKHAKIIPKHVYL